MSTTLTVELPYFDGKPKHKQTAVHLSSVGLEIGCEGCGLQECGEDYFNPIIFLEFYEGKYQLHVWANINQTDPTHSIDLSGALKSNRKVTT